MVGKSKDVDMTQWITLLLLKNYSTLLEIHHYWVQCV